MLLWNRIGSPRASRIALALGLLIGASAPQAAAWAGSGFFSELAGTWSGDGTVKATSGANERIRCRANYVAGDDGNSLEQQLRCASDSYRFDIESKLSYNKGAGVVTGTWREKENGVGGRVLGPASAGRIKARVEGGGFAAAIEVLSQGGRQTVSIKPENTDITEVAVDLKKS